jgi:hypothetical protein
MAAYESLARSLFADNDAVSTYRTLIVLDAVKAPVLTIGAWLAGNSD